jgi:hypothetical protein
MYVTAGRILSLPRSFAPVAVQFGSSRSPYLYLADVEEKQQHRAAVGRRRRRNSVTAAARPYALPLTPRSPSFR